MARNRLQQSGVPQQYGDQSAPGGNPYSGNPYGNAESQPLAPNSYGQGGASYPPNSQGGYSYGQQDQYSSGGAANGGGDFWSELNNTNAMLGDLEQSIQAIRGAHQQTLNSTDQRAVQHADKVSADARALRQQCKEAIKKLFKLAKGDKTLRTQADAASKRFTGLLNEHQTIEKEYRQRSREKAERQYRIVKPDATPDEVEAVISSDDPQVFATALLSSGRYSEARGAYKEVQDRHNELLKVQKTMTELAQMFNEMSMLVEQQDEQVAEIVNNTQQADTFIQQGNIELDGAVTKAKAARRKRWICFWIIIIIIIAIALAVGIPLGIQAANKK